MAEPTAFEQVFNPDQEGTLTGFLGRAFGNQSPAGTARGQALEELSNLHQQNGGNPQAAIVSWLTTPAGIEAFHRDPNIMQTIQQWTTSVTPPAVQNTTLNPGDSLYTSARPGQVPTKTAENPPLQQNTLVPNDTQLYSGNGRTAPSQIGANKPNYQFQKMGPGEHGASFNPDNGDVQDKGSQPTTEQQNFSYMQSLAKLDPKRLAEAAEGHMLVQGRYEIKPMLDLYGENTGSFIISDKLTGRTVPSANVLGPNGQTMPNPAAQSDYNAPLFNKPREEVLKASDGKGNIDLDTLLKDDKRSMFLGSGANSWLINSLGQIARNVDPRITDAQSESAVRRNDYIQQLQFALHNVQENGGGLGTRSDVIKQASALAPSANSWRDPKSAVTQGMQLYDMARHEYDTASNETRDLRFPVEERKKAAGRMRMWQGIIDALPQRQEMVDMYKKFPSGQAGAVTSADVIGSTVNMGGAAVRETGNIISRGSNALSGGSDNPAAAKTPKRAESAAVGENLNQAKTAPQASPVAQPQAPGPRSEGPSPYTTMSEHDIVNVNPAKLAPAEQDQYKARLDQLIAEKKKQQMGPSARAPNTVEAEEKVKPTVHGQPTRRRVTIEEHYK